MRHALRDFFRRIRVERHRRRHGSTFLYHGTEVTVPPGCGLGPANSLIRDKYERDEAAMILKHLPTDFPVIELGGSLGIISSLIRSRIDPATPHVVVEANAELVEICTTNATSGAAPGMTEVFHAAIYHDGPSVRFASGTMSIRARSPIPARRVPYGRFRPSRWRPWSIGSRRGGNMFSSAT